MATMKRDTGRLPVFLTEKSSEARYSAYIRFAPDEQVRLGMSVMVRVVDEENLPEDAAATALPETDNKGGND